jgi:dihydrofolate synthase/folylpolyglutamate synthase
LLEFIGNPQKKLKFIHIAGTNGKGSISSMISQVLIESGYKTGLFTSPHLYKINERFQINGECIDNEELSKTMCDVKKFVNFIEDKVTEFEFLTAIGFEYFFQKKCDVVVLEAGLGGFYDSTNVIDFSEVAVISSISYDHTEILGNSLVQIASEKAGIIKNNSDVVVYEQEKSVYEVIKKKCFETGSKIWNVNFSEIDIKKIDLESSTFVVPNHPEITIKLLGIHQIKNACTAIKALEVLKAKKVWNVTDSSLCSGLKNVKWPFRFEIINTNPFIILDGAHNLQGIEILVDNLKFYFLEKKISFVVGVLRDKSYSLMFKLLASIAKCFYVVNLNNHRSLDANFLSLHLKKYNLPIFSFNNAFNGFKACVNNSKTEDIICCTGSLYLAKIIKIL